jgi:hypothetical protein
VAAAKVLREASSCKFDWTVETACSRSCAKAAVARARAMAPDRERFRVGLLMGFLSMGLLPKRATEGKVLIYKDTKGTGRIPAVARPVLSVLLSDLKRVREERINLTFRVIQTVSPH